VPSALAESAMPAWRQGQAVGEWREVSGTALASAPRAVVVDGNTGPQSKVIAWNSFVIDTRSSTVYSPANGGHHDYAGNELNKISLLDASPAWSEPRSATPMSQVVDSATHYADGRPTSRHTFYGAVFNEQRNRAMVLGGAQWGNGYMLATMDGFNASTNDWDTAGTYANTPSEFTAASGSAVVENKGTGDIYTFASFAVSRWNSASNTWAKMLSNAPAYGQYAASAMDTRRNRILVAGGGNNDHAVYDVAGNTMSNVTFTGPNASVMTGDTGNGMVYDIGLDAYLLRKSGAGGAIYRIDAQTFSVDTLPSTNGASVPSSINGVWKRFIYVPQLKGVVYFPSYDGNLWFLRTS
jgi:hypothetical protein